MPYAPKRPCRYAGCSTLSEHDWCPEHTRSRWSVERETACKRGYDRQWRNWRLWYLQRHPLCSDCEAIGLVKLAEEVHHKVKLVMRPDLQFIEANCMPLCKAHHTIRTNQGQ